MGIMSFIIIYNPCSKKREMGGGEGRGGEGEGVNPIIESMHTLSDSKTLKKGHHKCSQIMATLLGRNTCLQAWLLFRGSK